MRYLLVALVALTLTTSSYSQSKDTVAVATTPLLSINDYEDFVNQVVLDLPARQADVIRQWFNQRFTVRVKEYNDKKKKQ